MKSQKEAIHGREGADTRYTREVRLEKDAAWSVGDIYIRPDGETWRPIRITLGQRRKKLYVPNRNFSACVSNHKFQLYGVSSTGYRRLFIILHLIYSATLLCLIVGGAISDSKGNLYRKMKKMYDFGHIIVKWRSTGFGVKIFFVKYRSLQLGTGEHLEKVWKKYYTFTFSGVLTVPLSWHPGQADNTYGMHLPFWTRNYQLHLERSIHQGQRTNNFLCW